MEPETKQPENTATATAAKPKPKLSVRLKALLEEYGSLAITIYFSLFALVFAGFAIAISVGVQVKSAAGGASLVGAAWLATKLTQPLRILATLALTPIVARLRHSWRESRRPVVKDEDREESAEIAGIAETAETKES